MFDRIRNHERKVELDSVAVKDLKALLFGPPISIQSVRLLRSHAVLAAVTCSHDLAKELEGDVRASMAEEPSSEVRQVLESVVQGCKAP